MYLPGSDPPAVVEGCDRVGLDVDAREEAVASAADVRGSNLGHLTLVRVLQHRRRGHEVVRRDLALVRRTRRLREDGHLKSQYVVG